jgi:cytochrome c-type biogenesis protein CcmH
VSDRSRLRLGLPWALMGAVLAVALFVGASRPGPVPSLAQRAAALEGQLRCPSCEDVSVADSSAPVALSIKGIVERRLRQGQSDGAIESFLVSRYGEGILLRPPTSGGTRVVWVVPIAALAGAAVVLGAFLWRRRRTARPALTPEDRLVVERALAERGARG